MFPGIMFHAYFRIVCVHKSFCFFLWYNYTKQREKAQQRVANSVLDNILFVYILRAYHLYKKDHVKMFKLKSILKLLCFCVVCVHTQKVFHFWVSSVNKSLIIMLINIYFIIVFAHKVKSVSFR